MKKFIAFFLALLMAAAVTGCNSEQTPSKEAQTVNLPTQEENGNGTTANPLLETHTNEALKSDSYTVTNGMLTYFYLTGFYSAYSTYGSYLQSMGFDTAKPLDEQLYGEDMTWHDYFLDMTLGDTRAFLRVAEAAKADGFDDSFVYEEVQKQIDNLINREEITLDEYISKMYGNYLDEGDLRNALWLQIYAYSYYDELQRREGKNITTEECEEYYKDNKKSLSKVDYISYTVTANTAGTEDAEGAYAEAEKKANELVLAAQTKGVEGFSSLVKEYMTEQNETSTDPMTEEALATQIEKILSGTVGASYSEDNELSEFCFEDGRKAGDCKLVDNGAGSYTVTVVSKSAYRVEDITKNVRHILFKPENYDGSEAAAKEKAEEILAEWRNGEATVESYDALAKKYNGDGASLYENVYEGEMPQAFNDWLFDSARQVGDTDVVETDYGYHIVYFAGDGYPIWEADVRTKLISLAVNEILTALETEYPVTDIQENLELLPVTIPSSAFEGGVNVY